MEKVQTFIYRKPHRSGKVTWVVRWFDPKTGRWCNTAAGRSKTEASIMEARIREDLLKGVDPRPKKRTDAELRVSDLIDLVYESPRFLSATPKWQDVTRGNFENIIRPKIGSKYFSTLKRDDVYRVYLDLKESGISNSTILRYHHKMSILGQLYRELHPDRINPIEQIRDFRKLFPKQAPTRDINFLTPDELELIFEQLRKSQSKMTLPFIKFLAHTGLRKSEALDLQWTDIDFASGFIQIRKSKTGTARRVPLEKGTQI